MVPGFFCRHPNSRDWKAMKYPEGQEEAAYRVAVDYLVKGYTVGLNPLLVDWAEAHPFQARYDVPEKSAGISPPPPLRFTRS